MPMYVLHQKNFANLVLGALSNILTLALGSIDN